MSHAEKRNVICGWCSEEVEEVSEFDLGTGIVKVCPACWEDLKSEYGVIGAAEHISDSLKDR